MGAIDASPSGNGHGSDTWFRSWTHLSVDRCSLAYCRVTFDHPPANTITATTVAELAEVIGLIEEDTDLDVVVFATANPDRFLGHYDVDDPGVRPAWRAVLVRLSHAPVLSIALVRGRIGAAGSEFMLACDLRFGRELARTPS